MSYAGNENKEFRDYWDSIGKPKFAYADADVYGEAALTYLPYQLDSIIVTNVRSASLARSLRLQYPICTFNGTTFVGARDMVFDYYITHKCNISCNNCCALSNVKSISGDDTHIELDVVQKFIDKNKYLGKHTIIKLLGGEPVTHPLVEKIVDMLSPYFTIWILTNGIKDHPVLHREDVFVENSMKVPSEQPMFHTMYMAPIDDKRFANVDYSKGCQMLACGHSVDYDGQWHICTVGRTLKRVIGVDGYTSMDECNKNKEEYLSKVCKYCGLFKRQGYHDIDKDLFLRTNENPFSDFWKKKFGKELE